MGVKDALAEKTGTKGEVKLTKSMSIADMIKAMKPEIEKALPKVITPERFTRMALSALNTTPKLQECSQMSFLGALMNAAQLGLEPNTPLGQAYLIPYKNHGKLECQFQIGYKGLIDMVYRNDNIQTVQAQCVYENDVFEYELGLEPKLVHKPAIKDKGEGIRAGVYDAVVNALESRSQSKAREAEIHIYLEGDADKLFKIVRKKGQQYQKSTGKPVFS